MRLNRLNKPPIASSRAMRAYMAALLEVSGMMSGQPFPLHLFMENFATHLRPKAKFPFPTMRKTSNDLYVLTPEGIRFFSSRLSLNPIIPGQRVNRSEVLEMTRRIVEDRPALGWSQVELSNSEA